MQDILRVLYFIYLYNANTKIVLDFDLILQYSDKLKIMILYIFYIIYMRLQL